MKIDLSGRMGGAPLKTLIIVEFASMALARAWYASAEYAEALKVAADSAGAAAGLRRRRRSG